MKAIFTEDVTFDTADWWKTFLKENLEIGIYEEP